MSLPSSTQFYPLFSPFSMSPMPPLSLLPSPTNHQQSFSQGEETRRHTGRERESGTKQPNRHGGIGRGGDFAPPSVFPGLERGQRRRRKRQGFVSKTHARRCRRRRRPFSHGRETEEGGREERGKGENHVAAVKMRELRGEGGGDGRRKKL